MNTIEDGLYRISPWMRTLLHLTMDAIQVHQSIVHSSDTIPHMAFEWINDAPYVGLAPPFDVLAQGVTGGDREFRDDAGAVYVRAPKRYHKLYLVTV